MGQLLRSGHGARNPVRVTGTVCAVSVGLFATPGGITGNAWLGLTVAGHSDEVHITARCSINVSTGTCERVCEISTLDNILNGIGIFLARFGMSTIGLESHRVIAVLVPAVPYKRHR